MPLPMNYLLGIDLMKREYEGKMWSYLRGEWRYGRWWYYYLYALAIKEPLGDLAAGGARRWGDRGGRVEEKALTPRPLSQRERGDCHRLRLSRRAGDGLFFSAAWRDELMLLVPAVAVLLLVSSQTSFNRHFRFVLAGLPFTFIWASKVGRSIELRDWKIAGFAGAASAGRSSAAFPSPLTASRISTNWRAVRLAGTII